MKDEVQNVHNTNLNNFLSLTLKKLLIHNFERKHIFMKNLRKFFY